MNRLLIGVSWILLTFVSLPSVFAKDSDWPRTVPLEQGMVTIYSLQVDDMSASTIQFRAALAYRATADAEPVFGAGWFESPVEIDSGKRIVRPTDLKVTETRFPAGTDDVQAGLALALAVQSPGWNLDFSLDELDTALKAAEAETKAAQDLSTTPPRIIYRDHPALLVSMDGEAILREIENSTYKAVINTPYPLIFDNRHYYLNAAKDVWYRADKATGPYQFETNPPADIAAMVSAGDQASDKQAADEQPIERVTAANAPEIVVSTEPAELIVTEGPAAFVPLVDDLLVLQNSDDDVFMHVSSQKFYIVLAGRWYQAHSLNGPWAFQMADDLPTAFANIPRDSNQADSLVYVAGTEEARDAVLDAQVPQTAAVTRGEVDIEVKYDGTPVYEPVDGTDLVYIENTGSTVLQSGGLYYLVENGVWYVSSSANGPWQVSDHRPAQVDTILPSSPVYNVKYVHVYDSTPEVVYVGYTPGYTGSYVYRNTIFYGTGWHYRPWVSPYYYYPRFSTWGFNVSYNSWSGWNFGLSWGWGPFNVAYYSGGYWHNNHYWHHRHYGNWGPRGYRPRPKHHGRKGGRYAYKGDRHGSSGRNNGRNDGRNAGRNERDGQRSNGNQRNDNLYRDGSQRARVADTRDNQPRSTDRRSSSTRQASYASANGTRQKNQSGLKKGERNRAGPVSTSDLRSKAVERDTNRTNTNKANINKTVAADTRNNQSRSPDRRNSSTRQANYASANGTRQKNQSGLKKGERNRAGPVSTSDLRTKANVRDANVAARKDNLLADNSGNVYRKADRGSSWSDSTGRNSESASSTKKRTTSSANYSKQNRGQNRSTTSKRASGKSGAKQTTQPATSTSSRQSPRVAKVPTQKQTVARTSPKQRSSRNSARSNSAPVQKSQNSGRGYSAPTQNSRNSSRSSAAPVRSAPKKSAQRSSAKKNNSNKKGGSRSSSSRPGKS